MLNKQNMYTDINEFLKCKSLLGADNIEEIIPILENRYPVLKHDFYPHETKANNLKHWFSFEENRKINPLFKYNKNSLGFRDKELILDADLLCIGCSISYGVGIPEEYRWSNVIGNELNLTFNNLSISGISAYEVVLIVVSFLKFLNPKKILIFFPQWSRENFPIIKEDDAIEFVNLFQNYETYVEDKSSLTYKINKDYYSLQNTYSLDKFRSIIQLLFFITKLKNIPVYVGSWCKLSLEFINNFTSNYYNNVTTIDFIKKDNRGRDISHPGILFHKDIANKFIQTMKK